MSASFDHYDAAIASSILANHAQITGLPGYLGIRADEILSLIHISEPTRPY